MTKIYVAHLRSKQREEKTIKGIQRNLELLEKVFPADVFVVLRNFQSRRSLGADALNRVLSSVSVYGLLRMAVDTSLSTEVVQEGSLPWPSKVVEQ